MSMFGTLHSHPVHRSRQKRWILPAGILLFLAVAATLAVLYSVSNQDVQSEFFKAHKSITHTGQLLDRGIGYALGVLVVVLGGIGIWALRATRRIVRPVHTIHRALDELVTGNLGVRLERHRQDEFQEVGTALNRLIDEFTETLTRVHALVDEMDTLAEQVAREANDQSAERRLHELARELNGTMDYFRLAPEQVIREEA